MFDRFFDSTTRPLYIARPESAALALVHRHPDTAIPRGAKLTVRSDESAVFFREGRAVGMLKSGAYQLDTQNIPFLGSLVNPVTGGNHFLAELFFVRLAETPVDIGDCELGSFVDVNSRNLLRLMMNARITVTVTDALALITQMGGQSALSGAVVNSIVSGRLRNALKAHVAREAEQVPIYRIVSNASSEAFGNAVVPAVSPEFARVGLKFVRFVELHLALDEESMTLLREYQRREADLTIDAKGAQIAADPGFTTYNAVKGGRSVADGLGSGLSKGFAGPVIGMGLGVPGMIPGGGVANYGAAPAQPPIRSVPPVTPGRATAGFIIDGPSGHEGPFTARQVALWILASGKGADEVRIRQEQDPSDLWSPASAEPSVMMEIRRRSSVGVAAASAAVGVNSPFEAALAQAASDRRLTADEIALLASLALSSRMAASDADARALVLQRAMALGCTIEPASDSLYAYWDGAVQTLGLTATAVAERVSAASGLGMHMVWTPDLGGWVEAKSVSAIASLMGRQAPPPPPPMPPPSGARPDAEAR